MPYVIRKKGGKYCVYKESGGSSLGCHDSQQKAERQRRAIIANEGSAGGTTVSTMDTTEETQDVRGDAFEGVLAVVGQPTSDGRYLIPDEVSNRDLPIPVMVQTATEEGHMGAEACGRIDSISYIPVGDFERGDEFNLGEVRDEAVIVWAEGTFDTSEFAKDAERMMENGAGVSIDMPPERIAAFDPETFEEIPEDQVDFQALMEGQYLVGIGGKIAALTVVSIPAFEEASIMLVPGNALVASAYGIKIKRVEVLTAAAAGAAPLQPPKDWFFTEEPNEPVPLTVTPEGKVYGHLALWYQCHPAFASCERAPSSATGYSYFHVGEIETAEGDSVPVGRITVGKNGNAKGGHASVVLGKQGAMEHYDTTGCVAAFVRASDGKNGIWLSGAVRSDAPAEKIRDLKANPPSGDWRDQELVGVLAVPVPGFPIPRVEALIASADNGQEEMKTLIASGYSPDYEEYEPLDIPTYRRRLKESSKSAGKSMNLVYVVQSVPSRAELRKRLLSVIPPAVIVEDDGPQPPSPWRGYRMCLEAFLETKAEHAVILQDDTIVCKNFATAIYKIAHAHPDIPVCLFVSGAKTKTLRNYTQAMRSKNRYCKIWFQDYMPVVATLWPRTKVEEFMEWWAGDPKLPMMKPYRSDDAVVGSWMKFTHQHVIATVPSIVEHPDDTLSVKWNEESKVPSGTGNKRRRAFWYVGDADPLELDWTSV